jgi:hypothetical protein
MKRDLLNKPFPPEMIRQRQGQGGKTLNYVEAHAVVARLNEVSDFDWSFEVVKHEVLADEVIVLGKLTIDGIAKMAFGGSSVTKDNSGRELSLADDLKSATSDAIKKTASLFGIGLELYGGAAQPEVAPTRGGAPTTRGGGPEPLDRITQRQLAAIHAAARRRGINLPELGAMLLEKTGKGEPQNLTRREASGVLDVLSGSNGTQR